MAKKDTRKMNEFITKIFRRINDKKYWNAQDQICVKKLQKNSQNFLLKIYLKSYKNYNARD